MRSQETEDRLGDLPDSIVFHILSFLNTKEAFQTCILSTRWNNLTKNLPILTLDSEQFESLDGFDRALSQIWSLRDDDSTWLHTLDLTLVGYHAYHLNEEEYPLTDVVLKRMVTYALSHNVRRLRYPMTSHVNPFPPLFSSQTLTSLDLTVPYCFRDWTKMILFPTHLNLPSLTDLTLSYFRFGAGDDGCADPFSAFIKLNTLTIKSCYVVNQRIFNTHRFTGIYRNDYNQRLKLRLNPPNLSNFVFISVTNQKLCLSHLCSLKHIYIDAVHYGNNNFVEEDAAVLLSSLQDLPKIKSLTVSSDTLQVLSLAPDLFKFKLTSLESLEVMQVQMKPLSEGLYQLLCCGKYMKPGITRGATIIPDGVVDWLIQNSPSANVSIIPYKPYPGFKSGVIFGNAIVEDTKAKRI